MSDKGLGWRKGGFHIIRERKDKLDPNDIRVVEKVFLGQH